MRVERSYLFTNCATTAETRVLRLFNEITDFHHMTIIIWPYHKSLCPEGHDILEESQFLVYCYNSVYI